MSTRPAPPSDATLAQAVAWHRGGRQPTAAHPLCVCRRPVAYPPKPEIDWEGHSACETVEERKRFWSERTVGDMVRWREACEAARHAARCPVHGVLPSKWSKPF